jgi:hypothetical protein
MGPAPAELISCGTMKPADRIGLKDAGELAWFVGRTFISSSFGHMLETARMQARDSEGKSTKPPRLWEYDEQGRVTGERQYTWLSARDGRSSRKGGGYREQVCEPPTQDESDKYSEIDCRLRAVGRLSRQAERVLRAYYGDEGARWAAQPLGRVWCLAPLTSTGRATLAALAEERQRTGRQAIGDGAELLAAEVQLDGLRAVADRRRILRQVTDQGEALLAEAGRAWHLARQIPAELAGEGEDSEERPRLGPLDRLIAAEHPRTREKPPGPKW